jgi:hypothetical protein
MIWLWMPFETGLNLPFGIPPGFLTSVTGEMVVLHYAPVGVDSRDRPQTSYCACTVNARQIAPLGKMERGLKLHYR